MHDERQRYSGRRAASQRQDAAPVVYRRPATPGAAWRPPETRPRFSVDIRRTSAAVVVTLRGPLDAAGSRVLDGLLRDLVVGQGNLNVVVDVNDLSFAHPSSLAVIDAAAEVAGRRGGTMTVIGVARPDVTA